MDNAALDNENWSTGFCLKKLRSVGDILEKELDVEMFQL